MKWHTAKCLFRHKARVGGRRQMYEERMVLVKASGFESAEKKAAAEADKYSSMVGLCEFVEVIEIYCLDDGSPLKENDEIFSRMYSSNLKPKQFAKTFFPPNHLGDCRKHGLSHRWFSKDAVTDGCYHCLKIKPKEP